MRTTSSAPVRRRLLPLLALATLPAAAAPLGAQQDGQAAAGAGEITAERCRAPEFREFDFWLGRWEVRNPDGEVIGHNRIRRIGGGCGLLEDWTGSGGGAGMSINTWDPELGRWTQRWVGQGATLWLQGSLEEGPDGPRMVLTGTHIRTTPRGPVLDRISWTVLPSGNVLQVWEMSTDDGASWGEAFRGLYVRMGDEAPSEGGPPQGRR